MFNLTSNINGSSSLVSVMNITVDYIIVTALINNAINRLSIVDCEAFFD